MQLIVLNHSGRRVLWQLARDLKSSSFNKIERNENDWLFLSLEWKNVVVITNTTRFAWPSKVELTGFYCIV